MVELRDSGCWGAEAIVNGCADPFGPAPTIDGAYGFGDRITVCDPQVSVRPPEGSQAVCEYSGGGDRGVIAVVGDSHSQILVTAVARWATEEGWNVRLYARGSCPVFGAVDELSFPNSIRVQSAESPAAWAPCAEYSRSVRKELRTDEDIKVVIPTNLVRGYIDQMDYDRSAVTIASVTAAQAELQSVGKLVIPFRDVPGLAGRVKAPECLSLHANDPRLCSASRSEVLPKRDPYLEAAKGQPVIDVTENFCDQERCYAAVGGVVAYWDNSHLTESMIDSLAPIIARDLAAIIADAVRP
jgi:hypothetical protein